MHPFPHRYAVAASAENESNVELSSAGVRPIESAAPVEFGGPGDQWSPESLLVASVADCFVLSFRAISRAARLDWNSLNCEAVGTLDKVERVTQFTRFDVKAELTVPAGTDAEKAHRLLEKAENHCLITNSMKAQSALDATVRFAD